MDTPFMNFFASGLADRGLRVVRFEFPYMAKRRTAGKKGPPDPQPILRETWLKVIKELGAKGLVIGANPWVDGSQAWSQTKLAWLGSCAWAIPSTPSESRINCALSTSRRSRHRP